MLNFPLVCRFCLIPSDINQTIGIFEGSNELSEKIFELTEVQVINEDGLPQEVCFVCREQLDLSVTFKKQVIRADCMLRDYLSKQVIPASCRGTLITGDLLSEEQKMVNPSQESQEEQQEVPDLLGKNQDKEGSNGLSSIEEKTLEEKLASSCLENNQIDQEFKSNNDNSESLCDDSFTDHIVKEEIDEDCAVAMMWPEVLHTEETGQNISPGLKKHFDEVGEKYLKDGNKIDKSDITQVKHEEKEGDAPFLENSELEDNDMTQLDIILKHSVKVDCSPMFCKAIKDGIKTESKDSGEEKPSTISESQGLRRSSRPSKIPERHVVPHYGCSKCERMYTDKATLENHEKIHLIVFKCNHCGKKFSNKDHLTKHIQRAHIGKSLKNQCEICGKSYEKRPHLFSHMRSHKSTVHLCDVCGKTVSLSAYPAHKRSHSNMNSQEVFHCDLCQKQFNNKMSLRTHKYSYHGALKFTCEVCGKQFTTMALMKHHQLSHSGKREHVCPVCSRAFTLKVTLRTHMRIHTGEMPYTCEKCGRNFTWKTTYRNHVASCKTDKSQIDSRPTNSVQHYNITQMPQNITQESPIDYSEDAKYKVPCDETKYRQLRSDFRYSSSAVNLGEGIKYPFQQSMYDLKSYVKDFKPT